MKPARRRRGRGLTGGLGPGLSEQGGRGGSWAEGWSLWSPLGACLPGPCLPFLSFCGCPVWVQPWPLLLSVWSWGEVTAHRVGLRRGRCKTQALGLGGLPTDPLTSLPPPPPVCANLPGHPPQRDLPPHDPALGPGCPQPPHLGDGWGQGLPHEAQAEEHLPKRPGQGGPDHR